MTATGRQVSRSEKTLSQAIRDGDIGQPPLSAWNAWQTWRREHGMRPTVARDGETTSAATESALWKSSMLEAYGEDWAIRVATGAPSLVPELEAVATAAGPGSVSAGPGSVSAGPGSVPARPGSVNTPLGAGRERTAP
jgi:hypothetical protein